MTFNGAGNLYPFTPKQTFFEGDALLFFYFILYRALKRIGGRLMALISVSFHAAAIFIGSAYLKAPLSCLAE